MTAGIHHSGLHIDFAPYRLTGTVYGTLLNHVPAWDALASEMNSPPYKQPPKAPILYVKPRNSLAASGDVVTMPANVAELEIGASLGIIIGAPACQLGESDAIAHVAGYTLVNDISQPHPDYYRPAVRFKARDGYCPIGPSSPRVAIPAPDTLRLRVFVDDQPVCSASLTEMRRSVQRLLVDVTDFMTLSPGDIITMGAIFPAPRINAGQTSRICCDGLGDLVNSFARAPS